MPARLSMCEACGAAFLWWDPEKLCSCGGGVIPTPYVAVEMDPTAEELLAEGAQLETEIRETLERMEGNPDGTG